MNTFGEKVVGLRKLRKLSQTDLGNIVGTNAVMIGRYENSKIVPSIEVAKKIANALDTTVGYLLSETDKVKEIDEQLFKRFKELSSLDQEYQDGILFALDSMLRDAKTRLAYSD